MMQGIRFKLHQFQWRLMLEVQDYLKWANLRMLPEARDPITKHRMEDTSQMKNKVIILQLSQCRKLRITQIRTCLQFPMLILKRSHMHKWVLKAVSSIMADALNAHLNHLASTMRIWKSWMLIQMLDSLLELVVNHQCPNNRNRSWIIYLKLVAILSLNR